MATRFYLPAQGAAAVSVAPDASWEAKGSFDRLRLRTAKTGTPLSSKTVSTNGTPGDVLVRQYVSDPLAAGAIAGSLKGIVAALESHAAADERAQLVIRVVSGDGLTVRGTLLASNAGGLASEFATVRTSRKFPLAWADAGAALTSVTAQTGDRLVIEIGYRNHAAGHSGGGLLTPFVWHTGTLRFGDPAGGTDFPENETTTDDNVPWLEFSQTIAFDAGQEPPPPAVPPNLGPFIGIPRPLIRWQFFLCTKLGVKLADLTYVGTGRSLSYVLGDPAEHSFVVPADHEFVKTLYSDGLPLLTGGAARVIKGYREEAAGWTLRYGGFVELIQDHGPQDGHPMSRVQCFSPLYNLGFRLVRDAAGNPAFVQFDSTPGAHIVRAAIDAANLKGATGATTNGGQFDDTAPRSVKWEYKMIRPAAKDLGATADGFDVLEEPIDTETGELVRISCVTAAGRDRSDVILAWKTAPNTASEADRVEDSSTMANAIIGLGGEGRGGSKIVTAETVDAASLAARVRREATVSYTDVIDQGFLDTLVSEHLRVRATGKYMHVIRPLPGVAPEPWTHFWLGDTVRSVAHADLRGGFDGLQRVYGIRIDVDDTAGELLRDVTVSRGAA